MVAPCPPTPGGPAGLASSEPSTPSLRVVGFTNRAGIAGEGPGSGAATPVGAGQARSSMRRRSSPPESPLGRLLREQSVPSLPALGLSISTKGCKPTLGVGLRTPASARGGGTSAGASPALRLRSFSHSDLASSDLLLSRSSDPIFIPPARRIYDGLYAEAAMMEELSSVESGRWGGAAGAPSTARPLPPTALGKVLRWTAAPPASPAGGSLRAMKGMVEGRAAARLLDQLAAAEADRAVLRSDCAALLAAAAAGGCVGGQLFDGEATVGGWDSPAADDLHDGRAPSSPSSSSDGVATPPPPPPPPPGKAGAAAQAHRHALGSVGADLAELASPGARFGHAVAF